MSNQGDLQSETFQVLFPYCGFGSFRSVKDCPTASRLRLVPLPHCVPGTDFLTGLRKLLKNEGTKNLRTVLRTLIWKMCKNLLSTRLCRLLSGFESRLALLLCEKTIPKGMVFSHKRALPGSYSSSDETVRAPSDALRPGADPPVSRS